MKKLYCYFYFPTEKLVDEGITVDNIGSYLKKIRLMLQRAECEHESIILYHNENLNNFSSWLQTLAEESLGTVSYKTSLQRLLYDAEDFQDLSKETYPESYIYQEWAQGSFVPLDSYVEYFLSYVIRENHRIAERCLLMIDIDPRTYDRNPIFVIYADLTEANAKPQIVEVNVAHEMEHIHEWLKIHRTPRGYDMNDVRHVEHSPQYERGKSPIIGGEAGKQVLEKLLPEAIGNKHQKDLIAYDSSKHQYIWYEKGQGNEYHGYHLVKPQTYQRDESAIAKIPQAIKHVVDILNGLKSL